MLYRIESIHLCNYLHRDIKPENFLIGTGVNQTLIHVIDFGLAKRYTDWVTGDHISSKKNAKFIGTAKYASLSAHQGWE